MVFSPAILYFELLGSVAVTRNIYSHSFVCPCRRVEMIAKLHAVLPSLDVRSPAVSFAIARAGVYFFVNVSLSAMFSRLLGLLELQVDHHGVQHP